MSDERKTRLRAGCVTIRISKEPLDAAIRELDRIAKEAAVAMNGNSTTSKGATS